MNHVKKLLPSISKILVGINLSFFVIVFVIKTEASGGISWFLNFSWLSTVNVLIDIALGDMISSTSFICIWFIFTFLLSFIFFLTLRFNNVQLTLKDSSPIGKMAIDIDDLKNKLGKKFKVIGAVTQLGILGCDVNQWNDKVITKNPFFCPDKSIIKLWEKYLLSIRKSGSSCGAIIEVRAKGIPIGLGAPIYSKLDMDLAAAMMSINAVKGVNIGSGMNSAQLSGEENSDEISQKGKKTNFQSNNAGGILGGISSGQDIIVSFAVKPTSSILSSRKTIDKFGKNTSISVKGRHDPCVAPRAVPIAEAMVSLTLIDHFYRTKFSRL